MECFGWTPDELLRQRAQLETLARHLVADENRVQDLVQETLLAALRASGEAIRSPAAWMAQVLRRRALQDHREEKRRRARQERAAVPDRDEPEAREAQFAVLRSAVDALDQLAEPYRSTLLMRYFEGLPPREIATRTETPLRTVNTRLARGLKQLRERLDRENGGDRRAWASVLLAMPSVRRSGLAVGTRVAGAVVLLAVATVVAVLVWPRERSDDPVAAPALALGGRAEPEEVATPSTADAREPATGSPPAEVAASEQGAESGTLYEGRVVDSHGAPVVGVEILFEARDPTAQKLTAQAFFAALPGTRRVLGSSDSEGAFSVRLQDDRSGRLTAESDSFASLVGENVPFRIPGPVELIVEERRRLSGIVVDRKGDPIEGAGVYFGPSEEQMQAWTLREGSWTRIQPRAESGEDGRFELTDAYGVHGARVVVHHPSMEYAPLNLVLDGTGPWEEEFVLAPTARPDRLIRGVVVDSEGAPVGGAIVFVESAPLRADEEGRWAYPVGDQRDPKGLVAIGEGRLPAIRRIETDADRERLYGEELVLTLGGPAREIRGRVVDAAGDPLSGYMVWVANYTIVARSVAQKWNLAENLIAPPAEEYNIGVVKSGPDGSFRVPGLLERAYEVVVMDPVTMTQTRSESVEAGTHEVLVTVDGSKKSVPVGGRLLGTHGDPIPGAQILLSVPTMSIPTPAGDHMTPMMKVDQTVTDEVGAFRFPGEYGVTCVVHVHETGLPGAMKQVYGQADPADIVLVVPRLAQVEVILGETTPEDTDGLSFYSADGIDSPAKYARDAGAPTAIGGQVRVPLRSGRRTGLLLVRDNAVEVRLYRGEEELASYPVHLIAGEPQTIHL